jgi:type II secretory pathway component PulF
MPTFAVSLIDRHGKRRSLREAAPDAGRLREKLRAAGAWPLEIRPATSVRALARTVIPVGDFVPVLHQLEMLLRAGVNADEALKQLAEDAPAGPARTVLLHVHEEVANGRPIHEACRFFARQFPPHVATVIAAGEASAQLPESMRAVAEHLAANEEIRKTAKRAMIYPLTVLVAVGALIVFLVGGVVPKFAEIFASLHLELPWITRALIRTSELLHRLWPVALGAVATMAVAIPIAARDARLKSVRDGLLLGVPVLGETLRCLATARFAAHARLLHEAGIPLLEALRTGAELMNNELLGRQLRQAREKVSLGEPLYRSLPSGHGFPGFIVPALKAGETTGQLGLALKHIEDYAARRARERLAAALAMLEPLLLAGLTAVVGLIALSFFLPLFSLLGGLKTH